MGTRADFYVGRGRDAEWIGSIAWDGHRDGIAGYILKAKTEANYRKAVEVFFSKRDDVTLPAQGWPWPWNDSGASDCSYWFFDGKCWDVHNKYESSGAIYLPCDQPEPIDDEGEYIPEKIANAPHVEFPDMSARKNITFGQRSGLIILTAS